MNRKALILYLRDLRDLEIAARRIEKLYQDEYYGAAEPPVRTNGATPFYLLSYFAIAGFSPYTSLIERSLDGSTLSISIL